MCATGPAPEIRHVPLRAGATASALCPAQPPASPIGLVPAGVDVARGSVFRSDFLYCRTSCVPPSAIAACQASSDQQLVEVGLSPRGARIDRVSFLGMADEPEVMPAPQKGQIDE